MGDACGPSNLPFQRDQQLQAEEEVVEEESFGTRAKRKKKAGGVAESWIKFRCKFRFLENASCSDSSLENRSTSRLRFAEFAASIASDRDLSPCENSVETRRIQARSDRWKSNRRSTEVVIA